MNTYDKQIDKLWNEFYTMRKNRYLILNYLVSIKFRITKNSIPASTINACIKEIVNEGKLINKIKKVLELQSYSSLDMISDISNIIKLISDKNDYICVSVYNNVNNDFEMDTTSFDDAIRKVLVMGGDTDTNACIVGSIAEAMYGMNDNQKVLAKSGLPDNFTKIIKKIYK